MHGAKFDFTGLAVEVKCLGSYAKSDPKLQQIELCVCLISTNFDPRS